MLGLDYDNGGEGLVLHQVVQGCPHPRMKVAHQLTETVIPGLAVFIIPGLILQVWLMNIPHRG